VCVVPRAANALHSVARHPLSYQGIWFFVAGTSCTYNCSFATCTQPHVVCVVPRAANALHSVARHPLSYQGIRFLLPVHPVPAIALKSVSMLLIHQCGVNTSIKKMCRRFWRFHRVNQKYKAASAQPLFLALLD
jgi:hypothetical protein